MESVQLLGLGRFRGWYTGGGEGCRREKQARRAREHAMPRTPELTHDAASLSLRRMPLRRLCRDTRKNWKRLEFESRDCARCGWRLGVGVGASQPRRRRRRRTHPHQALARRRAHGCSSERRRGASQAPPGLTTQAKTSIRALPLLSCARCRVFLLLKKYQAGDLRARRPGGGVFVRGGGLLVKGVGGAEKGLVGSSVWRGKGVLTNSCDTRSLRLVPVLLPIIVRLYCPHWLLRVSRLSLHARRADGGAA